MQMKTVFTEYNKNKARDKRIAELKNNIEIYTLEIKRWREELRMLIEEETNDEQT